MTGPRWGRRPQTLADDGGRRPQTPGRRSLGPLLVAAATALAACSSKRAAPTPPGPDAAASATLRALTAAASPAPSASAAATLLDVAHPNPLGLPPRRLALLRGARVFTFDGEMIKDAKPGSTLVLYAATVAEDASGDDLLVENKSGASFRIHAAYVIPVPDALSLKPGDPVITEHGGVLAHGVVTRLVKDRVAVRYTDLDGRAPEGLLPAPPIRIQVKSAAVEGRGGSASAMGAPTATPWPKSARFIKQVAGLAPGNYAALRDGDVWRHVLLVSKLQPPESADATAGAAPMKPGSDDGGGRWFVLGFGGAARIVDEGELKPIPVRWSPKPGMIVWAEWLGTMRRATVQAVDDPGLVVVKFERAGRPKTVGWGLVMAPVDG